MKLLYVLRGGSMKPFLWPGTVLELRPVRVEDLVPGNVVVFEPDPAHRALIAHRVVSVRRVGGAVVAFTRGDNTRETDPPLTGASRVVGKVVARYGAGRYRTIRRMEELTALTLSNAHTRLGRWAPPLHRIYRRLGATLMKAVLKPRPEIVFRQEGDEAFLFDPQTGEIKLLNETGAEIWRLLVDGQRDRDAIVEHLVATYDGAERSAVEADVDGFLDKMRQSVLLAETGG